MNTHGNVAGDPVNDATPKVVRTRSRFPSLSYHFYNTERFGEYTPSFVMDCVEGDRVSVRSGGKVSTFSLKAPLMQSIFKKKDFYMVPMEAILPINWEKFYTNPVVGDDVADNVGTGVGNFWELAYNVYYYFTPAIVSVLTDTNNTYTLSQLLTCVFRYLTLLEYFYSSGSLIKSLGASGDRYFKFRVNSKTSISFDTWYDLVVSKIASVVGCMVVKIDGEDYYIINDESQYGYLRTSTHVISLRTFLQMMRDDLTCYVSASYGSFSTVASALADYFDSTKYSPQVTYDNSSYDLRRLWAYQLIVAHFYSNDHVDFIYSAELFRTLIGYYVNLDSTDSYSPASFTYNGVATLYDSMSAYNFDKMITRINADSLNMLLGSYGYDLRCLAYFSALFSYRRSLRYVDYFTGSRSRPLAVGDVSVNVNSNKVDIVDVSRNIQRQRFFNAVNRFGRKFEDYIKGLSGITPDTDWHNPLYLAHTSDAVYGVETENTGVAQQQNANSITSRLMSNGSRYQFEFSVDRPCVVIGLSYYDMPRAYIHATERPLHHMNRFDMFNPFMQFIGDQTVDFSELGAAFVIGVNNPFGYQLRHMEYKQRYDQAAGGFVESLPGFLFTDSQFGAFGLMHIDPNFIRSLNSELDEFYVSLTGWSLGHYFHFIADNDNSCDASRPMAYAPSIL